MTRSVTCYPQPGKYKARVICRAFAVGAGGVSLNNIPDALEPGAAMFYGVRPAWAHLWAEAKADGRDWYYADNGYFPMDVAYFRIARNRVQAAQCERRSNGGLKECL